MEDPLTMPFIFKGLRLRGQGKGQESVKCLGEGREWGVVSHRYLSTIIRLLFARLVKERGAVLKSLVLLWA